MKKTRWFAALVIMAASVAQAQSSGSTRGMFTDLQKNYFNGFAPFVGLGAGYTAHSSELEVEGVPTTAKLIGSWTAPKLGFAFDAGLGFQNNSFSSAEDRNVQSTVGELAGRYQWENGIQAGLVWNTLFNQGQAFGANQADAHFIGLQAMRELEISDHYLVRVGGRYMTDTNVGGTWLNVAMVDVQIGWKPPVTSVRRTAGTAEDTSTSTIWNSRRDTAPIEGTEVSEDEVSSITDADEVRAGDMSQDEDYVALQDVLVFDRASSRLHPEAREKLEQLVAAIDENADAVGTIEVVGYADRTGSEEYNMQLSQERAMAVKNALVSNGLDSDKIKVVALGEVDPADHDMSKSRRAEIRFKDIQDHDQFERLKESIEE